MSICKVFWNFQIFSVFLSIIKFYMAFLAKKPMIRIHHHSDSCSDFDCFFLNHQKLPVFSTRIRVILTMIRVRLHFLPMTILQFNVDRWTFCKKKFELRINGFWTDSSMVSLKCNDFIDFRVRKNQMPYFWIPEFCSGPNKKPVLLLELFFAAVCVFFCCSVRSRKADARKSSNNFTTLFFVQSYRIAFFHSFFWIYDFMWIFDNCC